MPDIIVDGYDLRDLGFVSLKPEGLRDSDTANVAMQEVPLRDDALFLSFRGNTAGRRITVEGTQSAATLAVLQENRDALLDLLRNGVKEVVFPDLPTRRYRGIIPSVTINALAPAFVQRAHTVSFVLYCAYPYALALTDTVVALGAAPADVPIGDAPLRPLIQIDGPASDPIVQYRNSDGGVIASMDFTGVTLVSGDLLLIDTYLMTITDQDLTDRSTDLQEGSRWIRFSPFDTGGLSGPWGTLELSDGTGTATYLKAWR